MSHIHECEQFRASNSLSCLWCERKNGEPVGKAGGHGNKGESLHVLLGFYKTMSCCTVIYCVALAQTVPVDLMCLRPQYSSRVELGLHTGMASRHSVLGPEIQDLSLHVVKHLSCWSLQQPDTESLPAPGCSWATWLPRRGRSIFPAKHHLTLLEIYQMWTLSSPP